MNKTANGTISVRGKDKELLDKMLYDKIKNIIIKDKQYKNPDYSAKQLAKDIQIAPSLLAYILRKYFKESYSCLVNRYRIKDACKYLTDEKKRNYSVDDISVLVGFSNRQSFFSAFRNFVGTSPNLYREKYTKEKETSKVSNSK